MVILDVHSVAKISLKSLIQFNFFHISAIFRNHWKCEFRHLVFSELDHPEESDWIPDEGEVQVSLHVSYRQ